MTAYLYIKSQELSKANKPSPKEKMVDEEILSEPKTENGFTDPPKTKRPLGVSSTWRRRISFATIVFGIILFGSATVPILSYELFTAPQFQDPNLATPLSGQTFPTGLTDNSSDLVKVGDWFPTAPPPSQPVSNISYYTLTIPKLKIYDATVKIGGDDLSQNLVQYPGTSLPGQPGNAVIIGHSVLPQFFNPKNYMTIFSTLPTLRPGDDFYISYDGIQYRYVVEDMVEVEPTNFTVLEQRFDDVYATIITCVPPGLKTKRLAVRGRLVNNLKPFVPPGGAS